MGTLYRKKRGGRPYGSYVAKWRGADGVVCTASTGCRDKSAAMARLTEFERLEERIKAGIVTEAELDTAARGALALSEHVAAYREHLEAKGASPRYTKERTAQLERIFAECGWTRLFHLDRGRFERWLNTRTAAGMSAARRNIYQEILVAFANWAVDSARMTRNPFARMPKANVRADRRHERRAFTEAELTALLEAARTRPLHSKMHRNRGEGPAALDGATVAKLEMLGHERALIYRTLALTGLRRGELASITVSNAHLDGPRPMFTLGAKHEKSRKGAQIPLRADLAADIRVFGSTGACAWHRKPHSDAACPSPCACRSMRPCSMSLKPSGRCSTGTWPSPGYRSAMTVGAWRTCIACVTRSARTWRRRAYPCGRLRRRCGTVTRN